MAYRYYDEHPEEIWFPFGHGLSCTKFEYKNLKLELTGLAQVKVTFTLKNAGDTDGMETVQIYVSNPATCIYLDESKTLTDTQMQEIAKQHKGFVSEVVCCKNKDDLSFELIYYSSECEVDFCGHGTIACMYALIKNTPQLHAQQEISIHTRKKGDLTIYNRIQEQNAVYISAPEPIHLEIPVTKEEIAANLQIDKSMVYEGYPIDFIDAGNRTLIVPIKTLSDEINIFPDEQSLKSFSLRNNIDVVLIFCIDI